jgi:integrase
VSVTVVERKERKSKPWLVAQFSGGDRRRKSFATKGEALEWKAALELEEAERNHWHSPGALPCDQALSAWLSTYRHTLAASTEITSRGLIEHHLVPYFGDRDLRFIRREDVIEFSGWMMNKGLSKKHTYNAVSLLRRVCSIHIEAGLLQSNPAKGASRLVGTVARRYTREVPRADSWTPEEAEKLLAIAKIKEPAIFPAVLCLLHTGLRRGELLALKWEDVNFERKILTIRRARVRGELVQPKSARAREIPISPMLFVELDRLARTRHHREGLTDPAFVFLSPQGCALQERNFNRSFSRLTTRAAKQQVRPLNLHCTRHTFATMALEAGRSVQWVAGILGHSSPTITLQTYAHVLPRAEDDMGFLTAPRGESADRPQSVPKRPQEKTESRKSLKNGTPGGIRTPDPQVRSLMLYPAELPARILLKC